MGAFQYIMCCLHVQTEIWIFPAVLVEREGERQRETIGSWSWVTHLCPYVYKCVVRNTCCSLIIGVYGLYSSFRSKIEWISTVLDTMLQKTMSIVWIPVSRMLEYLWLTPPLGNETAIFPPYSSFNRSECRLFDSHLVFICTWIYASKVSQNG